MTQDTQARLATAAKSLFVECQPITILHAATGQLVPGVRVFDIGDFAACVAIASRQFEDGPALDEWVQDVSAITTRHADSSIEVY